MATRIVAPSGQTPETAPVEGVTSFAAEFTTREETFLINRKGLQLCSLLKCCYGEGQDWFEAMGAAHRDNLMWLASELATEMSEAFERLQQLSFRGRSHG